MQTQLRSTAGGTQPCAARSSWQPGARFCPRREHLLLGWVPEQSRGPLPSRPPSSTHPTPPAPALSSSVWDMPGHRLRDPLRPEELPRSQCRSPYAASQGPLQRLPWLRARLLRNLQQSTSCQHFIRLSSSKSTLM